MAPVVTFPRISVNVAGRALVEKTTTALQEVRVQEKLSQPSLCELTFAASGEQLPGLATISSGSRLSVTISPHSKPLFDGEITAIEYVYEPDHDQAIRVRAYDMLHRLRKRQPVRVHTQITPANLARELVADLALSVQADDDGPMLQRLIQHWQSDFDLLLEVTRRVGLYFILRGHVLYLTTLRGIGNARPLELGKTLLEARVEINADRACRTVIARGWDPSRVEAHEGRAQGSRVGREVDAQGAPSQFGESGERVLTGEAFQDDRHAEAVAQSELDVRSANEVTLIGTADGDPDLQPLTIVDLTGIEAQLEGQYVLTEVTHLINRRTGFISELSTVLPVFQRPPNCAVAAWGVVTSVDDPDRLGRVRVSLSSIGEVETEWMGVVAAGAGSGKGFAVLPDVADRVLVLLVGGDPAHGVVLGGLYGVDGLDDYGVEGTSIQRYTLATPGGQKVHLSDLDESIRFENKEGSFVELSPKKVRLYSMVDVEIGAPGREVVITGKMIDFRRS